MSDDGPVSAGTSPWQQGAEAAGSTRERGRVSRDVAGRLTMLMLLATLGVVITVWLPSLQQLFFHQRLPGAKRGLARAMHKRGYAVGKPEPKGHPRIRGGAFNPDNYRSRHGLPGLFGQFLGMPPGSKLQASKTGRKALARAGLILRDRADDHGDPVLSLAAGQRLTIVNDLGDWLLVSKQHKDHILYGWTRPESVVILP